METNEKLLSSIFNVGRLIREEIWESKCLAKFTRSELEVLKFLHGKKNVAMKDISDYLRIKPSSATPVIDNLAKKNILKRVKNLGDRRVSYVTLTKKGEKTLKEKYAKIHNTIKKVFKALSEKDKKILIKILDKIHDEQK